MKEDYFKNKICPICSRKVEQSDYLNQIFKDEPEVNYLAHMVTHYRHNHIDSWNKCWGRHGSRYRSNWFGDYEEEKIKINERAKRQIIRKGKDILNRLGITPEHFRRLQNTEEKTMELANKNLFKTPISND
ncbi:MAG: hypothetical protein K9I70_06005 [Chitinophagaceae bacterium]|nr:hypothetical protein [Chitinophagaceae bacterium]